MAMTTPVISSGDGAKMSFVMPSSFWSDLSKAPRPEPTAGPSRPASRSGAPLLTRRGGPGVELEAAGGGLLQRGETVAALWFGGFATKQVPAAAHPAEQ